MHKAVCLEQPLTLVPENEEPPSGVSEVIPEVEQPFLNKVACRMND
jgi:hypothetical protein